MTSSSLVTHDIINCVFQVNFFYFFRITVVEYLIQFFFFSNELNSEIRRGCQREIGLCRVQQDDREPQSKVLNIFHLIFLQQGTNQGFLLGFCKGKNDFSLPQEGADCFARGGGSTKQLEKDQSWKKVEPDKFFFTQLQCLIFSDIIKVQKFWSDLVLDKIRFKTSYSDFFCLAKRKVLFFLS